MSLQDANEIEVQVTDRFADAVDRVEIRQQVLQTLAAVAPSEPAALTVVITDDTTIQQLNREYLGIDAPTDVLAFSQREGADVPSPPDAGPRYLGDVIVSRERAAAQAADHDEPVARELSRLVIHGTLHLLGYDDRHKADREEMWELQERILLSDKEKQP